VDSRYHEVEVIAMSVAPLPAPERLVTGDELLLMNAGPCELIEGRIEPMSPTGGEHGWIEFRLARLLGNFVEERRLGWIAGGEVGIYTRRNPDSVRGADVAFISRQRLADPPTRGYLEVAPELVVEVLSPDDRWQDVRRKIEEYLAIGVERVWIVEPRNQAVLVYRSAAEATRLGLDDTLEGEGLLAGFRLAVRALFQS
jgi:Uma2 family endonuclease